ncbi:MAG: hypothetical protein D6709_12040, partial [Chloroflexi bacterium]
MLFALNDASMRVPARTAFALGDEVVYADALGANWANWSWGGSYNLNHTGTVYAGSSAIEATMTSGYAGLSLRVDPGLPGANYSVIQFWVHGGASGTRQLQVFVHLTDSGGPGNETNAVPFDAPAGQWTKVVIPLSAFNSPPATTIKRINIQDRTGAGQPTFYVDEIKLLAAPTVPADCTTPVYLDALAAGWQNWSWGGPHDFANSTTVQDGNFAIEANMTSGYAGLSFRVDPGLTGSSYTSIRFWVHGGSASGKRKLQVFVQQNDTGGDTNTVPFNATPGQWTQVVIPLYALGNPATIKRINIQDRTGAGQPTFYVDTVCLSNDPVSPPPPPPPNCTTPIYLDALAPNWHNWSWNGSYDFAGDTVVQAGTFAIEATMSPYGGLSFRVDPGLPGNSYTAVFLWVHGGASGVRQLQVFIQQNDTGGDTNTVPIDAPAGQWTQIGIPLWAFGSPATIKRINIQDRTGAGQPTFYVDTVCLS